jgi:hypothetical protein
LDFWPENRTLVKSAAAESDFGFGLGLRALPWRQERTELAMPLTATALTMAADLACRCTQIPNKRYFDFMQR